MRIELTQDVSQQEHLLVATTLVHAQSDNDCFNFSIYHAWNMRSIVAIWSLQLGWTASRSPCPTTPSSRQRIAR
jgi:hypothetical protein